MKETDVHQMLTAGVGLKARGVCLHQLRGRGRELGWRTQPPPPPCAHSTGLGLGPEYNSVFQDAAQAGSPSLWEGEGETTCFPPTSSKQEDEDGVNPHCLSCYLLFPLPLVYLLLGTPAGIGPDGASFV